MNGIEGKRPIGKIVIIAIIAIIALVGVIALVKIAGQKNDTKNECCETICGTFNQECRGWTQDTLKCTYNYKQYGYPWVEEIFTFKINDTVKTQICEQGIIPGREGEVTPVNNTEA